MEKEVLHPTFLDISQKTKLTDWKNEPDIKTLQEDLRGAMSVQKEQIRKIDHWNDVLLVRGSSKHREEKGRSKIQPKLVRRQAEWRYSALSEPFLSSEKLFSVSPRTFEDVESARQNELLLNYQFRTKLDLTHFVDSYIRACVNDGTAIVKVNWSHTTKMEKEEVPVWEYYPVQDEQQMQMLQEAMELKQSNPKAFSELDPALIESVNISIEQQQPITAIQIGSEMAEVERVLTNQPDIFLVDPRNFYFDPSCQGQFDKALFAIETYTVNRADLEKSSVEYKNLDRVQWNTEIENHPDFNSTSLDGFKFKDQTRSKAVIHEYWGFYDIHGTGVLTPIVAAWIGDTVIRLEESPMPGGSIPYVLVPYLPLRDSAYGETDAELIEDNQKILGAVMRGMIDLLGRSANSQTGRSKGFLDPLNKRKYEQGEDYEFNAGMDPRVHMFQHVFPEIPNSAMNMLALMNQDAESLQGQKSFSGGISGEAYGDVAAGIRGALDAASKREMAILRRLASGLVKVGRKVIQMNGLFLSDEEVIRVTNDQFIPIKREELQGEFDLIVDISTAEVDNAKAQDLGFMLQTLGPNFDPSMVMMILSEIAELKRMPKLAHQLRHWEPQPDPYAEKMKEIEMAKAELELEELRAKIGKLQAEAKKTSSEADLADLDFVEQDTGTKHEREIEKQRAQASGNQDLEITKALLNKEARGEDIESAIGYNSLKDKLRDVSKSLTEPTLNNRDQFKGDPKFNLGSKYFDPKMDPALNPNLNF